MKEELSIDIIGLAGACSYALDCIEAELVNIKNKHGKRVAYISIFVQLQRQVAVLPAHLLAAHHTLGILDGDAALSVGHNNDEHDHNPVSYTHLENSQSRAEIQYNYSILAPPSQAPAANAQPGSAAFSRK